MSKGLSFKLIPKNDKIELVKSKFTDRSNADEDNKTDFIDFVEDRKIQSATKLDKADKDLVIPLIEKNVWRLPNSEKLLDSLEDTLEKQAALEIIQESKGLEKSGANSSAAYVIPLGMKNRIPEGFETDQKMDVTLRPDSSTLDDYQKVPVEQFGLAMLRGMGWKPGAPIGLRNKECVMAVEVTVRPKGLGLGADKSLKRPVKSREEEEVVLVAGAYVCLESGTRKGRYGQVESLDEETGRAVVRLTLGGETLSVPELSLRPVGKNEYQKEGHVLNKDKYSACLNSRSESGEEPWVRAGLRVRLVDKTYKKGKYYNTKMIVREVTSLPGICHCRTEDGRLLRGIEPNMLETVLPRSGDTTGRVAVVCGKYKGEVARLLGKDKRKCLASIKLSSGKVVHCSFDHICEFVDS